MRVVDVVPPSASRESAFVLRAALAIVLATLFVISSRRIDGPAAEIPLLPYQRRFADLSSALQRDYRELREGFAEAARARNKGAWPSPERLAEDGVPPFASDGVDGRVRDWQLLQDGRVVWYLGFVREKSSRPDLLLQIVEPGPGDFENRNANTPIDEEHQRLADGTLVHVTTWFREAGGVEKVGDGTLRPEWSGWTQMVGRAGVRSAAPVSAPDGR